MTRRRNGWDYCAPGRYMVTLTLADRSRGWLGRVVEETAEQAQRHYESGQAQRHYSEQAQQHYSEQAQRHYESGQAQRHYVALTPLGRLVVAKWLELAANWPGIKLDGYVIMPDHMHGIITLERRQSHPLGQIVGSFKARSTSAAQERAIVPPSLLGGSLWSAGLTDSILYDDERYNRARAYIADNPRRLAVRRANPKLFAIRRDLTLPLDIGGAIRARFSAVGNEELLNRLDFYQVQCSRRYFAYKKDQYGKPLKKLAPEIMTDEFDTICKEALASARDGAVLVNPCISQGEREIARRAFAEGARMIILKDMDFAPMFKPEGSLFDYCVAGNILMLAPAAWKYSMQSQSITREKACALNRLAQSIARDGAVEIDYKGKEPLYIDEVAREATIAEGVNI